uniref:Uncharacterized protein n=1 Tax=Ditylenchus dipsaci TaxID=166011 RepID=A0A915EBW5_9BILA
MAAAPSSSSSKFYRRLDHTTLEVEESNGKEYRQEEKEEEYFYIHPRPLSQASESATIHFLTDDREEIEQHRRQEGGQWPARDTNSKNYVKEQDEVYLRERVPENEVMD